MVSDNFANDFQESITGQNPRWLANLRCFVFSDFLMVGLTDEQLQLAISAVADVRRNQVSKAEPSVRRLAQSTSMDLPIVRALGGAISVEKRRFQMAVKIFASLVEQFPSVPALQYNHALALMAAGQLHQGAAILEEIALSHPDFDAVAAPLAIVKALLFEHESAERWVRRAQTNEDPECNNLVGLTLMQSTLLLGREKVEGVFDFEAGQQCSDSNRIDKLLRALPPVYGDPFGHGSDLPTLFVAADPIYWRQHAMPLLWSVIEARMQCILHVHLFNPTAELLQEIERLRRRIRPFRLRVTHETVDFNRYVGPRTYCSNARFCRLHQLLTANASLVVSVDADMLVRQDLSNVDGWSDSQAEVGLTYCPAEPIWNRFAAGFAYFKPSEYGRRFLQRAAILIAHNLVSGTASWYLDQTALFEAYWSTRPSEKVVRLLDMDVVCDLRHGDRSIVWAITTDKGAPRYVQERQELQRKYANCTTFLDFGVETVKSSFGPMMILSNDRYIGPSIKCHGAWCSNELELLKTFLPSRGVVVDGGANIGAHSIPFAQFVGPAGRVLAFEPQRLVFYLLAGNVALNSLTQVECYNLGLSDTAGELGVGAPVEERNFGCVPLLQGKLGPYAEIITTRTLDSFHLDQCDLIKLDIEGMELEALQGARQTIEAFHPFLYLENHQGPKCQPLIDLVHRHGYRAYWHGIETNNPNLWCIHRSRPIVVEGLREADGV